MQKTEIITQYVIETKFRHLLIFANPLSCNAVLLTVVVCKYKSKNQTIQRFYFN